MDVIRSQISGVSIVFSTVCSDAGQRKQQNWPLWEEFTGDRCLHDMFRWVSISVENPKPGIDLGYSDR